MFEINSGRITEHMWYNLVLLNNMIMSYPIKKVMRHHLTLMINTLMLNEIIFSIKVSIYFFDGMFSHLS